MGLRSYCHSIHSELPDLPHTEIKGCGRSFTLYPDSKDEERSPHCLLQVSSSLGGPSQALGTLCSGQTCPHHPLLLHWGAAPSGQGHRSLHSTTGNQESPGKASSAEKITTQITTESNKYYLVSCKTSYKKP